MNYHFTPALAHNPEVGGTIEELLCDHALILQSDHPFKGNIDIEKLENSIQQHTPNNIAFIRMEASTNLIGGQPFSFENMTQVRHIADKYDLKVVLDASLLGENAFLIQQREAAWQHKSLGHIIQAVTSLADIVYFLQENLFFPRRRHCNRRQGHILKNGTAHSSL